METKISWSDMRNFTVFLLSLVFFVPTCFSLPLTSSYGFLRKSHELQTGRKLVQKREAQDHFVFRLSCSFAGPFPYIASLRDPEGKHRCGAVLVRPDAVLTAASCVKTSNNTDIDISQVFLGGFDRDNPIQKRKPVATIVHESFSGDPRDGYDIAVIKLHKPSCLTPVRFIGRQTDVGEVYILLGFGRTGPNTDFSFTLQGANVTNFDISQCNKIFGANPPLDTKKVCTKSLECDCASSCEGDQGGPVILRETTLRFEDTLIALQSYSNGECGTPGSFSVHTDIQPFENWLSRTFISEKFLSV